MSPRFHKAAGSGGLGGRSARARAWFAVMTICASAGTQAALPSDWQNQQAFKVETAGLIRMALPPETLGAARPLLEDLRLYDDAGHEVPFLIQRPSARRDPIRNPKSFQVSLARSNTVITLETGINEPLAAITLESPALNFIKAVSLEGSADGQRWQPIARGQPIFRQDNFAGQLELPGTARAWNWLRLTVDDERSSPIPITGARLRSQTTEPPLPSEVLPVSIVNRQENPGETRLTLDLGAANLHLTEIEIETGDPLFTRSVNIAVQRLTGNLAQDQVLGSGTIYRVALEGNPTVSSLALPFDTLIPARQLFLLVHNQDSPPLRITAVRAQRRPVHLVFLANTPGVRYLLTGNKRCAPASYDLAALRPKLQDASLSSIVVSSLEPNPSYHRPEVLPEIQEAGIALDTSEWRFRKTIDVARPGPQQVELDLDVLARARPGFEDVRLMRGGRQIPYILERPSGSRPLNPVVTVDRAEDPQLSRWRLKLPRAGLPLTTLRCESPTPLFRREMVLYESITNELSEPYRRTLGQASWSRAPGSTPAELRLRLDSPPQTDTLVLETGNGDNPAIKLEKVQTDYPITRLLFKADTAGSLHLFYGHPHVPAPHYDLSLVAGELLAAEKSDARPGGEEPLAASTVRDRGTTGKGGFLFWGVLALVVCALLAIISRLLPKTSEA